jgi:hypothetical protein
MRFYRLTSVDGAANRRSDGRQWSIAQNTSSILKSTGESDTRVNQGPDSENAGPRVRSR